MTLQDYIANLDDTDFFREEFDKMSDYYHRVAQNARELERGMDSEDAIECAFGCTPNPPKAMVSTEVTPYEKIKVKQMLRQEELSRRIARLEQEMALGSCAADKRRLTALKTELDSLQELGV